MLQHEDVLSDIAASVVPEFTLDGSDPAAGVYRWRYVATVKNRTAFQLRPVRRTWNCFEANGGTREFSSPLKTKARTIVNPGEDFQFSSHFAIGSPYGMLTGVIEFLTEDNQTIRVKIPPVSLVSMFAKAVIH